MAIRWAFLHDQYGNPYTPTNPLDVRGNVRILDENGNPFTLDNRLEVTSSFTGLRIGGKVTIVNIDDTSWTPLPLTPKTDRNAILIQNTTGVEIKLNYSPDILSVGYVGMIMYSGGEKAYDITDEILIYARAEPGSGTVPLAVEEIA